MARQIAYGVIPMMMVCSVAGAALGQGMQTFKTEKAAQRHCPADTVVWLNTSSANYHFKSDPWYGRTQRGIYACKVEADKDGLHAWTIPASASVSAPPGHPPSLANAAFQRCR